MIRPVKSEFINIRVKKKLIPKLKKHIKEHTYFDNISDYIRSLIRCDMKRIE
jgi:Arc/MetJ-type ribon-helix-helix transcriptional regulator